MNSKAEIECKPAVDPAIIFKKIKEVFPEEPNLKLERDWVKLDIEPSKLIEICQKLKADQRLLFDYFACLSGVDKISHFEVVYHIYSTSYGFALQLRVKVDPATLAVPSVVSVWPGANWYEREAYDMFGIKFKGHPNLKRILLDDDFEGHPLRKNYPLINPVEKYR